MADENTKIFKGMPLSGFPASAMQYALDGAKLAHQSHSGINSGPQQAADKGIIHVKNTTGGSLPAYSVVGLSNAVVFDETQNQRSYQRDPTILAVIPDEGEHEGKFAILLQPLKDGRRGLATAVGVSYCKIDVTDEEHEYADVADGETEHLVSGEAGFARILRKPSGTGVLECVVRLSGGAPSPSNGGGDNGGGDTTCCDTCYPSGSVEFADLEWATNYQIALPSPIGTVTVTDQGDGVWESDEIEVTCGDDNADVYIVTLTAAGVAAGEVSVTVSLLDGGGCEDEEEDPEPCCCEFAWKFVNCCIVDPLCGFQLTRDPTGIIGRACHDQGCRACVSPEPIFVKCNESLCDIKIPIALKIDAPGISERGIEFFSDPTAYGPPPYNSIMYDYFQSLGSFVPDKIAEFDADNILDNFTSHRAGDQCSFEWSTSRNDSEGGIAVQWSKTVTLWYTVRTSPQPCWTIDRWSVTIGFGLSRSLGGGVFYNFGMPTSGGADAVLPNLQHNGSVYPERNVDDLEDLFSRSWTFPHMTGPTPSVNPMENKFLWRLTGSNVPGSYTRYLSPDVPASGVLSISDASPV